MFKFKYRINKKITISKSGIYIEKMDYLKINSILIGVLLLAGQALYAQNFDRMRGLPFLRNYLPEEYHAHEQNFDIIQANNGFMYFANFAGILEFDGSGWAKIPTMSGMRVVSLTMDGNGKIFAGGLYDFGFIETDPKGQTKFVSLTDNQKHLKNIGLIFKVLEAENKVYFFSEKNIYIYDGQQISTISLPNQLKSAFRVHNQTYLFFNPENTDALYTGLYQFINNQYIRIDSPEGLSFMDIQFMEPWIDENQILIGTSNQGLFLLENNLVRKFENETGNVLNNKAISSGVKLNKSVYALGFEGGIVLINTRGKILQRINRVSGLHNENINALFLDKKGSLWSVTDNGLSKAEINWPLSYIDNRTSGLEGIIFDIEMYGDKLVFATDKGLFYLDGFVVRKVSGLNFPCLSMTKNAGLLFVGTARGIYLVTPNMGTVKQNDVFTFYIAASKKFPNRIYSGENKGLGIYQLSGNQLRPIESIQNIQGDVVKIEEDNQGDLIIEVNPGKIYVYTTSTAKLTEIGTESTLLSMHLNKKGNEIFISTEKGLYRANKQLAKLEPYFLVASDTVSQKLWMHQLFELSEDRAIFTNGEQKALCFLTLEKKLNFNQTPFLPLSDYAVKTIWYDSENAQIWAGGKDGLIISNQKNLFDFSVVFNTFIRKITLVGKDSLVEINRSQNTIKYADNSLSFEFTVPVYPVIGEINYRYFLKGFDKDSSQWTVLNKKEYTNLPDGNYTFIVEAKNEFGKIAPKATYSFRILTPLYRQWWAFLIYIVLILAIGRWVVLWRTKAASKEKERLEALVRERTEEIERSKEQIEEQRDIAYRQKKEILDSISYAQKIQQAVLPSQQYVDDMLLEHFILYRPRDIVSGDFYWMKKINNYIAVVAADCTGHGVPGAFMSMLGSSFLNEIVTRRSLDNAAQILNRLRSKVKKSLHQEGKEGEQKDGMDIALIIIDSETLELQYSGAYNPLYIIRQNKHIDIQDDSIDLETRFEFIQLKADRQPIGIHLNEKDFTNHVFQLQNGDNLYSFSDGYVDQFGGETGEKFKHKRFKDLLLSVQGKPMSEQKTILEHAFVRWKRDLAQIDDVLVMGIKI
jgi:serine phosphatase RsbU (regulator of sigma subunit)/ligand-binding sensor domain-containing protein